MKTRLAVVTGASSDIGTALVKVLLQAEFNVVAQVNKNRGDLAELPLKFRENLHISAHDLSDRDSAEKFIKAVGEKYSQIDVLVNTIGPLLLKPLHELTPSDWEEQIHFNLNLAFYLGYHAKDYLLKSKGHIINFTFAGVDHLKARVDSTAYCAAKAGLVILTKSLATAFASTGVRVNAISPGLVEAGCSNEAERIKMAAEIPFGRAAFPSEVAEIMNWLILKSPSYLTGGLIPLSGAWEYI